MVGNREEGTQAHPLMDWAGVTEKFRCYSEGARWPCGPDDALAKLHPGKSWLLAPLRNSFCLPRGSDICVSSASIRQKDLGKTNRCYSC